MKRVILILCVILCAGFGLNYGLKVDETGLESNYVLYQVRNCNVVECYPDESDPEYQWVYIEVSGGEYDGHLYEMHRPANEGFHAEQGLEVVFNTANTSDPTDDMPVNVLKPNMV